ncbi:Cadherin-related family member 5 [Collichthys lucidus]|uniref:Cadherin-related family member 5 n=1 Tax=Collichthys lucidus TaxID=240159 RepID=A0A4U5UGM5_COLLU|nr:Cadherin-related family member 5 [Collichthys lucidus]
MESDKETTEVRNKISFFEHSGHVETSTEKATQNTPYKTRTIQILWLEQERKKSLNRIIGNFQPTTKKAKPEVPDALFGPSNNTDEVAIEQVLTTEQLKLQKEKDLHTEEMLRAREREQKLSEDFEKMKKMLDNEVINRQHAATCETNVKISDLEDTKVKRKQDEKSIAYLELENKRLQGNNDKLEKICTSAGDVKFDENKVGVVATIRVKPNVALAFTTSVDSNYPFGLSGSNLTVVRPLDYEFGISIVVEVVNLNDNSPVFAESPYNVDFTEDTPIGARTGPPYTATTTINVNIVDADNRPPWFQPCTQYEYAGGLVCQSSGYTGKVTLNEQVAGVLPLKPGPVYAIDGDFGINQKILYSFLTGSDLFKINENSGNITMVKPADVLGPISLTVLATQSDNNKFTTTTVTITVQVKSLHPPKFQKSQYEGIISAVGTMAKDPNNKDQPLIILATDDDYAATEGRNPHIKYSVKDNSDFSIIDGYLFMIKDLPEGPLSLTLVAIDTSNDESDTAPISVEVISGLNTTTVSMSTEATTIGESTTDSMTTEDIVSTTNLSTAASTTMPSGSFGSTDMAILGATLGVLLFICLVVIGVLACQVRRGKADWQKIYETSMFRSSLGQGSGGQKEGIQYTNDAFQNDEDGNSTGSIGPEEGSLTAGKEPRKAAVDSKVHEANLKFSVPLHAVLPDNTSEMGSDKDDSEKEVKPILTRERRMDEGYKSVWWKEDIDPNAKEEVVIIPDSRENDSDEEDDEQPSSSKEEDEDDSPKIKTRKVGFNETDLDSGLGVKMEDPADDSEADEMVTEDL